MFCYNLSPHRNSTSEGPLLIAGTPHGNSTSARTFPIALSPHGNGTSAGLLLVALRLAYIGTVRRPGLFSDFVGYMH